MKYLLFSLCFLSYSLSNAQDIKLNYSKGGSLLFFDVDSKTEKLSSKLGLSLSKNNSEFQLGYSTFNFNYDGSFQKREDVYKNYMSEVQGAYISYSHNFLERNRLKFSLGLELAFNNYSISTNLENNQGILYSDYCVDQWSELGYFSENNFETDMSILNIDQLEDYNLYYLNFGPSIECSYELVDNFELFVKSIYRKNTTDILDNVNVNNQRGISSTNSTDNQLDLMFGIKFQFNNKQAISNDSLISYIDFITGEDSDTLIENQNPAKEEEPIVISVNNDLEDIKDNKDYILGFFDFNADSINLTDEEIDEDFTEIQTVFTNESSDEEEVEIIDAIVSDNASDFYHYLVIGVFSSQTNSVNFARSLQVDSSNVLYRNNMYYLYAMKSNNINEIRQLRDSFEYDSWVMSVE